MGKVHHCNRQSFGRTLCVAPTKMCFRETPFWLELRKLQRKFGTAIGVSKDTIFQLLSLLDEHGRTARVHAYDIGPRSQGTYLHGNSSSTRAHFTTARINDAHRCPRCLTT